MKAIKVLFITHCAAMEGANRSMFQLIMELRDTYGIDPFVLLPPNSCSLISLKDFLVKNHIFYKEYNIPFFKVQHYTRENRLSYVHCYQELKELCLELKSRQFDIVHSNSSVIDFGAYISRTIGVKHIWHLREFGDLDYNLHSMWGRVYEKMTYRNGEAFIAISKSIKKHFTRTVDSDKIVTIYDGIMPRCEVPLADHMNECVHFLCAGVICDSKNQLEIVKALDLLVNTRRISKLHLTLVGREDTNYLQRVKKYVSEHNINDYITFHGETDGIEQLASSMDVGVMSSKCEAFGRVTVEYMCQNLAVIANDTGANQEIIENGKSGLIYKHNSVEDLADKMQMLIEDRCKLRQLAASGRKTALERFHSSNNTESIFQLYCSVLNVPSRRSVSSYWTISKIIMHVIYIKDLVFYNKCSFLKLYIDSMINAWSF